MIAGQNVKILSANGTGRVAGHGVVVGHLTNDIVAVKKSNGKQIGINISLLEVEA